jgi:hypothetical protein
MKDGPFKPGSRVQAVWEVFKKEGQAAAFAYGKSQTLAESTLLSWVRGWAKNANQPSAVKGSGKGRANGSGAPVVTANTVRVREIGFPRERQGTLHQPGPEVSLIKWDTGEYRAVSNEYIIRLRPDGADDEEAKTDAQRKEEEAFMKKQSAGMQRMKENLGAEATEAMRTTVMAEQEAAMADVKKPRKRKTKK